ncbi:hypothetical protein J437_LFUL012186 [Ladona fulva]|uniref:RRM domain-containing protein n=1 Tax=Ladona fulva TaxID=123851 RepID=A0A8K0NZB4_LADFU|nr:hypothetical protein J437_LFUL012186 [Ladona fulva]
MRRLNRYPSEMDDDRTLWCGNISEKVTQALLYELFLQGGPLERVYIPRDKDGKQRRFAFIVYKHSCSVPYAAALFEGTALFNRVLLLKQQRQSVGNDSPRSSGTPVHQRALPSPTNVNVSPALMSMSPLTNPYADANGVQNLLNMYKNQLMSIPSPITSPGNMNSLVKSSLMGTWNRNHPYSNSLRGDRDHDRRGSGYNRMEPDNHKRYNREEGDSHKKASRIIGESHKKYNRMDSDPQKKNDHHNRRYHHRRDYR